MVLNTARSLICSLSLKRKHSYEPVGSEVRIMKQCSSCRQSNPLNIQSMFAEAAVHLNLLSVPLRCPAVITEQVVSRRFTAAEEICAQVVGSAASPVKSGFMGMENSVFGLSSSGSG